MTASVPLMRWRIEEMDGPIHEMASCIHDFCAELSK